MNKADNAAAAICSLDIRGHLDPAAPLEESLRFAFQRAQHFWMSTDDNVRFMGALAAVLQVCSEEDKELITRSKQKLDALSAAMSGIPVDLEKFAEDERPTLPLLAWYREAKFA